MNNKKVTFFSVLTVFFSTLFAKFILGLNGGSAGKTLGTTQIPDFFSGLWEWITLDFLKATVDFGWFEATNTPTFYVWELIIVGTFLFALLYPLFGKLKFLEGDSWGGSSKYKGAHITLTITASLMVILFTPFMSLFQMLLSLQIYLIWIIGVVTVFLVAFWLFYVGPAWLHKKGTEEQAKYYGDMGKWVGKRRQFRKKLHGVKKDFGWAEGEWKLSKKMTNEIDDLHGDVSTYSDADIITHKDTLHDDVEEIKKMAEHGVQTKQRRLYKYFQRAKQIFDAGQQQKLSLELNKIIETLNQIRQHLDDAQTVLSNDDAQQFRREIDGLKKVNDDHNTWLLDFINDIKKAYEYGEDIDQKLEKEHLGQ